VGYGGTCALQLGCTPTSSSTNVSICPSALPYTWNGRSITEAGTYTNLTPLTNSCGSDSTATVVLTVKSNSSSSTPVTICASALPYSWNGTTINAAGTYAYLTNLNGNTVRMYAIGTNGRGNLVDKGYGSLDFIAGSQKRAPKWMQNLGLEWLYRLIQQPSRIRRIYKATIRFVILISQYYRNIDKKHKHKV
jgi:hypothetical protein